MILREGDSVAEWIARNGEIPNGKPLIFVKNASGRKAMY
jgi:hypothetical protein